MNRYLYELLGLTACIAVGAGAIRRVAHVTPSRATEANAWSEADVQPRDSLRVDRTRDALLVLEESNPFRFSRRPSSVRHGEPALAARPPLALPDLRLSAVVGGPPWRALLSGLPGTRGAVVVDAGDEFSNLTVLRIVRDSVVLRNSDTTWAVVLPRGTP